MKNRLLGFLLLLYLPCLATAGELAPYQGLDDMPALALEDLGGTIHTLADYRGQVVLVNFWASWCAPCLIEMPGMQRLLKAMEDRPFTILAVNVGESREKAWRFTNLLKVDFVTLLDRSGSAAKAWNVQVYPTSFLIDAGGNIRYTAYGSIDWDSEDTRRIIEPLMPDTRPAATAQANGSRSIR